MTYKLTKHDTVIRISDNAHIPADLANTDYATYLAWRDAGNVPLPADGASIEDLKAAKLGEINAECDRRIAAIRLAYPETEVLSWHRQEREARSLKADPSALTPLIDGIAAQRGQTRGQLADLVIAKADRFASLTAPIIGTRHMLVKQIEAATAPEQVGEIAWP